MKIFALAALVLIAMPIEANAIQRYTSTRMNCEEVRATIRGDGVALMRYKSKRTLGLQLFGRYVRSGQFCSIGEYAKRVHIPAADTNSCPVNECKRIEDDRDDLFLRRD
jgi:hypothetical protein